MHVHSLIAAAGAPSPRRAHLRMLTVAAVTLLGGCSAGPDFKPPAAPDIDTYTAQPLPARTASTAIAGGAAQRFMPGRDIPGDWWTLFHSRPLNALIAQSLAHNPDLKAAQAALRVAHESTLAGRGAYYPSVGAEVSASRGQDAPRDSTSIYKVVTPQVDIAYVPDLFGLNRRALESLAAQEQSARYQMIAAWNTLTTNVVVAAIQQASLQQQVDATRQLIGINQHSLKILQYQLKQGYASGLDVAAQASQLAQVKASLPPLVGQLVQQQNVLAVLSGRFPGQAPTSAFRLSSLHLPADLPLSLPSKLVHQRPDVLQAQADMHAASAQIGVAAAARLPNIELTANAGSTAMALSRIFRSGTGFWSLGADIAAPIFQGGALRHQERAARAAYVQAAEQYRSTVLIALQNVADTLTALQQDAEALNAAAAAAGAAEHTLQLAQRQAQDGYSSPLSLLGAEQAWQQAQIALVQAQANRYLDTAALYQALGGGWWHHANLGPAAVPGAASPTRTMPIHSSRKPHD